MLAEKYVIDKEKKEGQVSFITKSIQRIKSIDPEALVGQLADILFKGVLIFAIPYFIYVLVKFINL